MNYYPFHIGDYIAHTAHLEPIEDCAYRRLLDAYYMGEVALPADAAECARKIRMKSYLEQVEQVLREFFVLTEAGWTHARCEAEIAKMQDKQTKARASAEASVNARKKKSNGNPQHAQTSVERTLSERSTDAELPTPTPTPTPTPIVSSVAKATADKSAKITDPAEIIFGYGVSMLVSGGISEKQARSFLGGLRKAHGDQSLIDKLRACAREKPLQPLEWLAAALPPPAIGAAKSGKAENFEAKNYGSGVGAI